MFIDQARIFIKAGNGGDGCQSFYRDRYNRRGTPDGGDGGKGSDIIVVADRNLHTLLDFRYNKHFRGKHGGHGSGKKKKGKNSAAVIIRVPVGTIVKDAKTDCVLRDLDQDQQLVCLAYGGKGGLGNKRHLEATKGQAGEERELLFDLKLIADAGVLGLPNAGKSTLISNISGAHTKIAAYPFTTKFPILGVVEAGEKKFVIADLPGLIEGSSQGRGLGDRFLRHIERTKILVHVIDMSGFEGRDPIEDYRVIQNELKDYSEELTKKKQIVAANKMDLEQSCANLKRFMNAVKAKVYPISALKKEGLEELVEAIAKKL